jgi:hypothetical protein
LISTQLNEGYSKKTQTSLKILEFMLSLPIERKIPKVTELETVYATAEQQKEMEKRLLKKNNNE